MGARRAGSASLASRRTSGRCAASAGRESLGSLKTVVDIGGRLRSLAQRKPNLLFVVSGLAHSRQEAPMKKEVKEKHEPHRDRRY